MPLRRQGTIISAVLIVCAIAAMLAAGVLFAIRAQTSSVIAARSGSHAYLAAWSGLNEAMALFNSGDVPVAEWYDNPQLFQNRLVAVEDGEAWCFTIYAHNPLDNSQPRFGLTDEASKILLDAESAKLLIGEANMTDELVDCLVDYLDEDDETSAVGAERDYYASLEPPYLPRNGPLETIEELLLIKGFSGRIVFGEDFNLNGVLDSNESDGDDSFPPDDRNDVLDTGLAGMIAVNAWEYDVDSQGRPRVNINGDGAELENLGLPQETVDFILAYRQAGQTFSHPSQLLGMTYRPEGPRRNPGVGEIASGVDESNLAQVLDVLTVRTSGKQPIRGLVNINTAPQRVLRLLEGFDDDLAGRIVDARRDLSSDKKSSIAWLVEENVVEFEKFKEIAPVLTARSFQFRLRCVGFGAKTGSFCAIEAVFDVSQGRPRLVYIRDITRLGLPVAIDVDQEMLGAMR